MLSDVAPPKSPLTMAGYWKSPPGMQSFYHNRPYMDLGAQTA